MKTIVIRRATAADAKALSDLAEIDSRSPITGSVLLAEADEEILAALSVESGRVIADPFRPTADLVAHLRLSAIPSRPSRRRRFLARPSLRARLAGA